MVLTTRNRRILEADSQSEGIFTSRRTLPAYSKSSLLTPRHVNEHGEKKRWLSLCLKYNTVAVPGVRHCKAHGGGLSSIFQQVGSQ